MIDIEKFLCSLLSQAEGHHGEPLNRGNIQEALREQGCEIVDGKLCQLPEVDIVDLERPDNNLKLLRGHWYRSVIMIDDLGIEKDDVLYCSQDGYLDKNDSRLSPSELEKWLRFFDEVPGKRFEVGSYIKRIGTSDLVRVVQINDGFYRVSDIETDTEYDIAIAEEGLWEPFGVFDYKPGAILSVTLGNNQKYILIYRQTEDGRIESYVHWAVGVQVFPMGGIVAKICDQVKVELATRTEQAEFMSELSKAGYRWNPETRELIPVYTTKFKVGDTILHRENRDVQHTIETVDLQYGCYRCTDGSVLEIKEADEKYIVTEFHERLSDLDLILEWFAHIEQMATDRKTLNGCVMRDCDTLDEIKVLAKNSQEYIKAHVVPEKIVFSQGDIDQMVCKFKNEPLRSEDRVADIYRRGIEDTLKELKLRYGGQKTTD